MGLGLEARDHALTMKDKERFHTQAQRTLERLRRGPATNAELKDISLRYGARIFELRLAGFNITTERLGGGLTRYRLVGA